MLTPEAVGDRLVAALGSGSASVSGGGRWARATVDVPVAAWPDALRAARDDADLGCDFFDWLSAIDDLAEGFTVVAHVWSTVQRHGVLVRTRVPREAAVIASVVEVYPGAAWHERETHEMFGVDFTGHPGLLPLLLPPEFEGHPMRKEFVLASRVAKDWPGAKEPGESHDPTAARRQKMRPPGVPDPNEWGPNAGAAPPAPERPARPPRRAAPAAPPAPAGASSASASPGAPAPPGAAAPPGAPAPPNPPAAPAPPNPPAAPAPPADGEA